MGIGERIRTARHMAGMSQRALAKAVGVSAMAISKYERDLATPGSAVLIRLARTLGVRVEYFLRPHTVTLTGPTYRRRASLPRREERAILAQAQDWLERYNDVEALFPPDERPQFDLPTGLPRRVEAVEEAEQVAQDLRLAWDAGLDPLDNLAECLEDHGVKIGLVDGHEDFDALTLWTDDHHPVMVLRRGLTGDCQRFSLAHELGHLVLRPAAGLDAELVANRFAAAFLVPESAARSELGAGRRTLGDFELYLLKHKYGLSMQKWVRRAGDLGIISRDTAQRLIKRFRQRGWHRREPGEPYPTEEPQRMKRLVYRALAEDLISESRAAELLGAEPGEFRRREHR